MSTVPQRPAGRRLAWLEAVREFLWILALGVIAAYAFFLALGAFAPGDVLPLTLAIGVLVALWLVHAALARGAGPQDPRLRHDRERRGF
jgi:membrane protein implicated in regulation of membrane protease activity